MSPAFVVVVAAAAVEVVGIAPARLSAFVSAPRKETFLKSNITYNMWGNMLNSNIYVGFLISFSSSNLCRPNLKFSMYISSIR